MKTGKAITLYHEKSFMKLVPTLILKECSLKSDVDSKPLKYLKFLNQITPHSLHYYGNPPNCKSHISPPGISTPLLFTSS